MKLHDENIRKTRKHTIQSTPWVTQHTICGITSESG